MWLFFLEFSDVSATGDNLGEFLLADVQTDLAVCKDQVSRLESADGDLQLVKLQLSSELEAEKLSKETAVNDQLATIADLELTNQTQQETCSSLQCENYCLVQEKSRLQTKLQEDMECLAELRETILGMEQAGKNDRAQWDEEKANLQSDIVDLQATVKGLEATQSSYIQELEVQSQSAAQMQIDKDKLKASYEKIVEEARTMTQQKADMEKSIEEKMTTILRLQLANQKQVEECIILKEQGGNFAEKIASLESSLEQRDRCVAEMKEQSAELQMSIKQSEIQWEEEKAVWESSNVNLQAKLKQSVGETRENEQSVACLNQYLTKLKDEHEKLQVSHEEMLADVKTLNEQRLLSEKTIADHLATILDLQEDNKTQLDSIKSHKAQCSEEKTAQESTIVDLQRKLDISVKEALEKDQTVDSLNQHLTDIQDKHEKLQASYEKTLQTCSELQKEKDQAGLHQLESLLHTHKMQSEQLLQAKLQNKEIELPLKQGNTQQQKTIDELQNDNSRLATAWKTMQEKCVSLEKANKELKQKLSGYNEIMEILDRYRVSSCSDCSLCLQYK